MNYHQQGQYAALVKLGFDFDDAEKVLQVAKKYTLPKASNRIIQGFKKPKQVGLQAIPISLAAQVSATKRYLRKAPYEAERLQHRLINWTKEPGNAEQRSLTRNFTRPVIFPGASDPVKSVAHATSDVQFTPRQYKMIHAIGRGHELDEISTPHSAVTEYMGHVSPEVIMKEHNRLVTLPDEFKPIIDFHKQMRAPAGRETDMLKEVGVTYGEGERLNRHQRKHLTRLLEEAAVKRDVQARAEQLAAKKQQRMDALAALRKGLVQ